MRVAVIGSGVVGTCVGWHLARRGVEVVMIDGGEPGAGVSRWTFSWVNASNKTATQAYFDLNVAGLAAHRDLADTLGPAHWWHPTGHLRWCDDGAGTEALGAAVDHLRSWSYKATMWEARRVNRLLEPLVRFPEPEAAVAFFPDEAWLDGPELVMRLLEDARKWDLTTTTGRLVAAVVVTGDQVTHAVLADGERIPVDAVVNAAGPAGAAVAAMVGRTLPLRDEPGLVARVHCAPVPVRRAMHAPHVEIRPDGPDRVVLHSRAIDSLIDPDADPAHLARQLHRFALDVVPDLKGSSVTEARVAWRPIPADGFPSVGAVDTPTGYYEAITHSGITLGVIIGRLLAQEMVEGTVDPLLAPYRPGRFTSV